MHTTDLQGSHNKKLGLKNCQRLFGQVTAQLLIFENLFAIKEVLENLSSGKGQAPMQIKLILNLLNSNTFYAFGNKHFRSPFGLSK